MEKLNQEASGFRKNVVELSEARVKSATRFRAKTVSGWIAESNPGPYDILRKIGEAQENYCRLLHKIADLLEEVGTEREFEVDTSPELSRLTSAMLDVHDLQIEFENQCGIAEDLEKQVNHADEEIRRLESELALLRDIESHQTFSTYESELAAAHAQEEENRQKQLKLATYKQAGHLHQTRLCGQNRHLREEIERISHKLQEERSTHEHLAWCRALAQTADMNSNE
jgi:hypothetical protein